eukprot:5784756-Alexandrium_andersonii.AAC.1
MSASLVGSEMCIRDRSGHSLKVAGIVVRDANSLVTLAVPGEEGRRLVAEKGVLSVQNDEGTGDVAVALLHLERKL